MEFEGLREEIVCRDPPVSPLVFSPSNVQGPKNSHWLNCPKVVSVYIQPEVVYLSETKCLNSPPLESCPTTFSRPISVRGNVPLFLQSGPEKNPAIKTSEVHCSGIIAYLVGLLGDKIAENERQLCGV